MKEDAFYFSKILSEEEQLAYQTIYKSLLQHKKQCELPRIDNQKVSDIFQSVISDHPELYYVQPQASYSYRGMGINQNITLVYKENYVHEQHLIDHEISKVLTNIKMECQGKGELEQYMIIFDYLVDNVDYQINNTLNQNAISALYYHKAQCSGISAAYKMLADSVGLYCIIVNSNAKVNGKISPHSWNIVKINNHYYHLDATYGIGHNQKGKKPYSYQYAFYSDNAFADDHILKPLWPKCDDDSLERLSNLSGDKNVLLTEISSFYELRNQLVEKIKNKEKEMCFYFNIEISEKQFDANLASSVKMVASNLRINIRSVSYIKNGKQLKLTLDY